MPGWSSTAGADQTIPGPVRIVVETRDLFAGTTFIGQQRRANTLTTTKYVGLTKDCAEQYVSSNGTVSTIQDLASERVDDSGQYAVIRVDIVYGNWA
jgi:hypothetical protein